MLASALRDKALTETGVYFARAATPLKPERTTLKYGARGCTCCVSDCAGVYFANTGLWFKVLSDVSHRKWHNDPHLHLRPRSMGTSFRSTSAGGSWPRAMGHVPWAMAYMAHDP